MFSQMSDSIPDLFNSILWHWKVLMIPVVMVYMVIVTSLRYQRARNFPRQFGLTSREPFCRMTVDDVQAILKDLTELEFPKIMGFSIIFALFKVWYAPSTTSNLCGRIRENLS